MRKRICEFGCLLLMFSFITGCATVGKEFNAQAVPQLKIGMTTKQDVQAMFGSPWRVGNEDGYLTWTYGRYKYSLFDAAKTKDLVIRFDNNGVVKSFTYSATEDEE
jgi:outer membrane protein assembly factor BamE (lipoprotein component of BamABCDE complex)